MQRLAKLLPPLALVGALSLVPIATTAMAIETPSALVRRKRAARREDDFISGTPLNISLFLLPGGA